MEGLAARLCKALFVDVLNLSPKGRAAGPDRTPNDILRRMPKEFHDILFGIFVLAWRLGHTPAGWKRSVMVLL